VKTFTFYSYKGGTGRSLLLANAARYLALLGKRVVAVDFDFEAPGLHYKLNISPPGKRTADAVPKRGAVDYLLAAFQSDRPPKSLLDYVVPVPLPRGTEGALHLMPAGSAPTGDYWKALTALLRQDPFTDPEGSGIAACLELKARIEEELRADFLLMDSRTGVTELAGVTTTVLADKVVCLMLANRESQTGARAVLRSLRHAPRLPGQPPVEIIPVLSRVPDRDESKVREALSFFNEPGPTPEDTLAFKEIFVLRVDPDLARGEKLHVGSGESQSQSPLHQDYFDLLIQLVEADPAQAAATARRQEAVRNTRDWLTDDYEARRYPREAPDGFREEQIDEGVQFKGVQHGTRETRYADLVAYAGEDRSEALLAVEYVEDLPNSDAWKWWQDKTRLRCLVLIGKNEREHTQRRVFTRGRRGKQLTERDERNGWAVRWPISFSALDDPGDRSVPSLLTAVQRGEDGFVNLLVREWKHASFVTLHGGMPFRPGLARQILDGLAQVKDVETEVQILWRTAPDPHVRRDEGIKMSGVLLEEMTTRELHAPLWWRLSVEAKAEFWRPGRYGSSPAGIQMLAHDIMGLSFDQDRDFRQEVRSLLGPFDEGDDSNHGAYRFAGLFQEREFKFEFSEEAPLELVRRAALRQRLEDGRKGGERGLGAAAERETQRALTDDRTLSALLRGSDGQLSVPTTNLLTRYDPDSARLILYSKVIDGCARLLGIDRRALANVVFLHETVHAMTHLGRDLDGRRWEEFALPSSRDPSFRPSALHETFAQFFSHRLLTRLGDSALLAAFERLSDYQPPEYQTWRKMLDVPVESVRKLLLRARAGLDDTPWG
jgi:CobQ/CobB/MinD/ParA nucleotide binding domain